MSKYILEVKTATDQNSLLTTNEITDTIDFSSSGNYHSFEKHLYHNRDYYQLDYTDVTVDLYRLAASIYIADKTVPRSKAFDNWTRELILYFPVHNIPFWNQNLPTLIELLSFLTGDHWEIVFTQDKSVSPEVDKTLRKKGHVLQSKSVSLFSGGLDSLIGVVDSIMSNGSVALVGHTDHALVSKTQQNVFDKLKAHFSGNNIDFIQFFLQPKNSQENTTRSRSILFLTLGTMIASAIKVKNLIVPENGVISLNVPLTYGRIGSLSTRTTHPNTIKLFNDLLTGLKIDVAIVNPYQFKTKGEMIKDAKDFEFIKTISSETMSCSHSTAARWKGRPSNQHCGYCLPCLIRRSSLYKNNLDNPNDYQNDIHNNTFLNYESKESNDLRAILYTLEKKKDELSLTKVISTGPLYPRSDIDRFVELYDRGLIEISNFINQL